MYLCLFVCEHVYGTSSSANDGRSIGTAKSSCSPSTTGQTSHDVPSTNTTDSTTAWPIGTAINDVTSWLLGSPLIELTSLVDGLFHPGLLKERVAEFPLLSDPILQKETMLDRLALNELPNVFKDSPGIH